MAAALSVFMSITIPQMIHHLSRHAAYQPAFGHPQTLFRLIPRWKRPGFAFAPRQS